MKTILLLLFGVVSYSQNIPYKTEIKGVIEIGGHIQKASEKFTFEADLDGVKIKDKKGKEYEKRKCQIDSCKTIHLQEKHSGAFIIDGNRNYLINNTSKN